MTADYPPEDHYLRDLRIALHRMPRATQHTPVEHRGSLPVQPELVDEEGCVSTGLIAAFVDILAGGLALDAATPDWLLTADFDLHILQRQPAERLEARGTVLRRGRSTAVLDIEVDACNGDAAVRIAFAHMTFAVIPRRPGTPEYDPETADEYTTFARPDSRLRAPLAETVGIRALNADAGHFEATLFPYVANSVGVLQGGVIAMLADAACAGAASALAGSRHTTSDLSLRYLAPARVGPFHTTAAAHPRAGSGPLVRIEVRDRGADDRLIAAATGATLP